MVDVSSSDLYLCSEASLTVSVQSGHGLFTFHQISGKSRSVFRDLVWFQITKNPHRIPFASLFSMLNAPIFICCKTLNLQ